MSIHGRGLTALLIIGWMGTWKGLNYRGKQRAASHGLFYMRMRSRDSVYFYAKVAFSYTESGEVIGTQPQNLLGFGLVLCSRFAKYYKISTK